MISRKYDVLRENHPSPNSNGVFNPAGFKSSAKVNVGDTRQSIANHSLQTEGELFFITITNSTFAASDANRNQNKT